MRVAALLFCTLGLAVALHDSHLKLGEKELVQKQYDLLKLYINIHQPSYSEQERTLATSFSISEHIKRSTNQDAVKMFELTLRRGLLPRGEVFNYYNPIHQQQVIQLFDLFFFAKDYATFYQAACWARNNVNEGMFVYALTVAILNRADTLGVSPPPMFEVFPHLYLNTKAIQGVIYQKQQGMQQAIVESNNTHMYGYWMRKRMESQKTPLDFPFSMQQDYGYQKLSQDQLESRTNYFTEDIVLNTKFAWEQLKTPVWLTGNKYQVRTSSGENFYYMLNQLLARYNLERLARELPVVTPISLRGVVKPGYMPAIQFLNGEMMPMRVDNVNINKANDEVLQKLINIDSRINDVIESQEILMVDGSKVNINSDEGMMMLGNLVQNNGDSINRGFYGTVNGSYGYLDQCRRVIASLVDTNIMTAPSAIEMDHSAMRDPVFYQCVSRVVDMFRAFKNQQKPYTMQQLILSGVKVQSLEMDKLITYLDDMEVEMFNAINYQQAETAEKFLYQARQLRVNHKPFTYKINVDSDKNMDVVVRVFLGPKYDSEGRQFSLEQARQHFVEIDTFVHTLKTGQNVMTRNSQDSTRFMEVLTNTRQMFDKLRLAQQGQAYRYNPLVREMWSALPQSLMLPLGSRAGQEFVLSVAVHDYQSPRRETLMPVDSRPLGFPFDRVVSDILFQHISNIHFQTVKIFLKSEREINNVSM